MRKWLAITVLLLVGAVLAGCNKTVSPEERVSEYTDLWTKQDFKQMFNEYVSPSVKTKVKKEDYTDRYQSIYQDLEVKELKVVSLANEEKDWKDAKTAKVPIKVSMDTLAGPISFKKEVVLKLEESDKEENWYVQWDSTYIFPDLEKGDKIRLETVEGERGQIFDRNGNSLAINGRGFEVGLTAGEEAEKEETKKQVADQLGITTEYIDKQLAQSWVQPGYFVPLKMVSAEEEAKLNQLRSIPGVAVNEQMLREYPYKHALGHVTGYIGQVNEEELKKLKGKGYGAQDQIGKRGLEQLLEERLRERDGKRIYIEKKKGEPVTLAEMKAKNGEDIKLALDAELQKIIYEDMDGKQGTAAAVDPKTGNVLALASSPAFDPNEFVLGVSADRYKALENDPGKPLLNRFAATYSPGSVIKPLTAVIGLKQGTLDPAKARNIKGLQWQKNSSWGSYKVTRVKDPGTPVNLQKALIFSDNIYFAQTALEAGPKNMVDGLKALGFVEKIPFHYPIRESQISNSGDLEKEILLSDTGYGQGEVLMSMLHLASVYGGIVNDGNMMKPQLYADGKQEAWKKGIAAEEEAQMLNKNLRLVVQQGTAKAADVPGLEIAGKTGTSELKAEQGTTGKENGLFVGYSQKNPEFVLAFMLEGVEQEGGSKAAVAASKNIFTRWKQYSSNQ